jgi:MoaD family protein
MKVKVRPWGIFQELIGERELEVNLAERARVSDLFDELIRRYGTKFKDELFQPGGGIKPYIKVLLNGHGVELKARLKDGDVVAIFPPVGGG